MMDRNTNGKHEKPERLLTTMMNGRIGSFFSPTIDSNQDTVSLGPPLGSPVRSVDSFVSRCAIREKEIEVHPHSQEAVNRLITALIDGPLVQKHVQRHLIKPKKQRKVNPRMPSTPALIGGSSCEGSSGEHSHDSVDDEMAENMSNLNVNDHKQPLIPENQIQEVFESFFAEHMDVKRAPQSRLCGLRVVHHRSDGSHAIMVAKGLQNPQFGNQSDADFTSLALPSGCALDRSILAIDNGDQKHVILRIVVQGVRKDSHKKSHLVIADVDVTECFSKAAIFEMIRAHCESSNIYFGVPPLRADSVWCACSTFPRMSKTMCTMQTLGLLSELDRITGQFQEFYITRATEMHVTGYPARLKIPYASAVMHKMLSEEDERDLMEIVAEIVGKRSVDGRSFASSVDWDNGTRRRVCCFPIVRPGRDDRAPKEWICFGRDGFDIGE